MTGDLERQNKIDRMQLEQTVIGTYLTISGLLVAFEVFIFGNSNYTLLFNTTWLFWLIPAFLVLIVISFAYQWCRIAVIFKNDNSGLTPQNVKPDTPTPIESCPSSLDEKYSHSLCITKIIIGLGIVVMLIGWAFGITSSGGILYSIGLAILIFGASEFASLKTNKGLNKNLIELKNEIMSWRREK